MSRREPPSPFTIAAVQGGGMLVLTVGALFFMKGLWSGAIRPAEIAAELPHWRDAVLDAVPIVLGSAAGALVLAAAALLAARHGRALVRAWVTAWWRYRRHWAAVMAREGLTEDDRKYGTLVPELRAVTTGPHADVLTVEMLPGQSPADWHRRAQRLAARFGASDAQVRLGRDVKRPEDIDLVFSRRAGLPERLALEAPKPPVLAIPMPGSEREVVALVRAFSLQIVWARVVAPGNNDRNRLLAGRVRWGVRWLVTFRAVGVAA
jgi:S-DNA-T family DNA segregation ATPase FtsK/SpoIIIE